MPINSKLIMSQAEYDPIDPEYSGNITEVKQIFRKQKRDEENQTQTQTQIHKKQHQDEDLLIIKESDFSNEETIQKSDEEIEQYYVGYSR